MSVSLEANLITDPLSLCYCSVTNYVTSIVNYIASCNRANILYTSTCNNYSIHLEIK